MVCTWPRFEKEAKSNSEMGYYELIGHVFIRAWPRLHAFATNSDWFIDLSVSVLIGQSD